METNLFKEIIKQIKEDREELVELNLANSSLDDFLIGDLCSALSHNSHITKLDLSNNSFSSEGIQHFVEFGNKSCPLIELNLSMNDLSGESLRCIAITVSNSNIKHLSVDSANIGRADISCLCALTQNSNLVTLSMNNNSIGDDGFSTLLSYLRGIHSLQRLYIQNNGITNHSVDAISHFVSENPNIQLIDIQGEFIGKEEIDILHSLRDSCQVLFTQPKEMEIESINQESMMINSFDLFQQDQIDLYTHYYIIMQSLYNQLLQWKHNETLPPLKFNSKLVGGDVTNSLINNQTLITNEFHRIRDQMIDLKESFYAVQNSPEYQMNEIAIRLITDNMQLIIQALTLPAYFVSAENNVHFSLENSLINTAGTIHRCGKLRIELILLLATLINRGYPNVIQAMIDNRIVDLVLNMFKDYPWNSVLHNAMGVLLTEIIESKSLELVHSALVDCNLYCRMKRQILSELVSRKQGEATSSGYLGVLHNVCCVIEATAKQNPEVEQAVLLMENQQTYTQEENILFDEMKDMNKEEEVCVTDFDCYDFSTV